MFVGTTAAAELHRVAAEVREHARGTRALSSSPVSRERRVAAAEVRWYECHPPQTSCRTGGGRHDDGIDDLTSYRTECARSDDGWYDGINYITDA